MFLNAFMCFIQIVIPFPLNLVFRGPMKPVSSMGAAVGLVPAPERGQRVLLMPLGAPGPHEVTARFVNRERGDDGKVELYELLHDFVPVLAVGGNGLLPKTARFSEPMGLVVVVVVGTRKS